MTILNKINNYKNKDYLKIHTITLLLILLNSEYYKNKQEYIILYGS